MRVFCTIFIVILLGAVSGAPINAAFANSLTDDEKKSLKQVRFFTEIYPPANYLIDEKLVGVTVDSLKTMWSFLEIDEQPVTIVPWARGYQLALDRPNTALFTMSRTASREKLFKWVGPVFHSTQVLMAKKSSNFQFENLGQVFYHKVAAVRGDISDITLTQIGFPDYNKVKVTHLEQAFHMLASERVDMIVVSLHGFAYLAKHLEINNNDYENVWQINKTGSFIAFHHDTPESVIALYQSALDATEKERDNIKKRYQIPFAEY